MEVILPRDMVNKILSNLNNYDLFQYGITSKRSLASAEIIWEKRLTYFIPKAKSIMESTKLGLDHEKVFGRVNLKGVNQSIYWFKSFSQTFYNVIYICIRDMFIHVQTTSDYETKMDEMEEFFQFIYNNLSLISQHIKFIHFLKAVSIKVIHLLKGHSDEKRIGQIYGPIFNPEEYSQYLNAFFFLLLKAGHYLELPLYYKYCPLSEYFEERYLEEEDVSEGEYPDELDTY